MKYIDPKKICFKETVNGRIYEMREGGRYGEKPFITSNFIKKSLWSIIISVQMLNQPLEQ